MNNLLVADSVSKNFGDFRALNKVSISVPEGSIFGLLGPNGAGKTTLIRIINQITGPDGGEVLFNDEKLAQHHVRRIGYLPEERGLYKKMEVGEQRIHHAEAMAWSDEEIGFALVRLDSTVLAGTGLQDPRRGRSHRHDASAGGAGARLSSARNPNR